MNKMASALIGTRGERIALADVAVSATLRDLVAEVTMSQTYRNDERVNIEAVYTFPLPRDATLLSLSIQIGERKLQAVVVEKKAAESRYEDAIEKGCTAIMLEMIEPGMYTMNVGNILPGESIVITLTYAVLHNWTGDTLRFFLPTTIAPRYGQSMHLDHQKPEQSLFVENKFSLRITAEGQLHSAQFSCPTHDVTLSIEDANTVVSLTQPKAVMDRDFVLNIKLAQAQHSYAQCGRDGAGTVAIACFYPFFPGLKKSRPLSLTILVDCSGSMNGDSIDQARQGVVRILESLQPKDSVNIIAFGDSTEFLSPQLLPCNAKALERAVRFARKLEANMGGTRIGAALGAAYQFCNRSESTDIFLITDGEFEAWQDVVDTAKRSGHRIFTVGVGHSVSESFVRKLAEETGGACELVAPGEDMADRIVRHSQRLRAPKAENVEILWPSGGINLATSQRAAVFEGDSLRAFARFPSPIEPGNAELKLIFEDGTTLRQRVSLPPPPADSSNSEISPVARLAAQAELSVADDPNGLAMALRYQLLSKWTNLIVVDQQERLGNAANPPELRKIPQTMAAGWGGIGSIMSEQLLAPASVSPIENASYLRRPSHAPLSMRRHSLFSRNRTSSASFNGNMEFERDQLGPAGLIELIAADTSILNAGNALSILESAGLMTDQIRKLISRGASVGIAPDAVASVILARLLQPILTVELPEDARYAIISFCEYATTIQVVIQRVQRAAKATLKDMQKAIEANVFVSQPASEIFGFLEELAHKSGDVLET